MDRGLTRTEVADLYRRYGALLRRRARLITRDAALAEDALQEACLNLLRAGATFREAKQPLGWLYRVIDRASIDQVRRGKRLRSATLIDGADGVDGAAPPPGVDADTRLRALEVLAELNAEEAEIVILAFVDGMTQSEIAEELGYSRVTINKRLQAVRQRCLLVPKGPSALPLPGDIA
ncbi:MAG: sigma-70 family RNA polymerase sigma factor [Polyangiaceae bacterium]|jgi:RNA polymerase sigma-70 factor (ECF subfamily)|nr:sigma-70 family RNA polymerase sigma factor [Polyangiaceae bacterium]